MGLVDEEFNIETKLLTHMLRQETAKIIISKSLDVKGFMEVRKYIWKAPNDVRNSRLWNPFLWRLCCRISCNIGISKKEWYFNRKGYDYFLR